MSYYSWTKESRTLYKKIKKYKCVKYDDILERYWQSVSKFQGIKGQNYYSNNKFSNNKAIIMLSLKYPQFNLDFRGLYVYAMVINTILLLLFELVEFQKIVPSLAPVVVKVINLLNIGFLNAMLLQLASFRWNSFKFIDDLYMFYSLGK